MGVLVLRKDVQVGSLAAWPKSLVSAAKAVTQCLPLRLGLSAIR